jgi:gliding motility-associated-like protein
LGSTYAIVKVSSSAATCPYTFVANVVDPDSLIAMDSVIQPSCERPFGTAFLLPVGGTAPYKAHWIQDGDSVLTKNQMKWQVWNYIITDAHGCKAQDSVLIKGNCQDYTIPNVFTPNNDGKNDILVPFPFGGIDRVELSIYNRWGVRVFTTEDPNINWDGKDVDTGVYYYTCKVIPMSSTGKNSYQLTGTITIMR